MKRAITTAAITALIPLMPIPIAGADGLLPSGPATVITHGPTPDAMGSNLRGEMCAGSKVCSPAPYVPLLWFPLTGLPLVGLETNVQALDNAIKTTAGKKVLYGFSGGARGTLGWLMEHAGDADAPGFDDLSLVLIGNPTRKYGGSSATTGGTVMNPNTPYKVLDIAQQYDLIADFPQNPFNLLALANAAYGFVYLHLDYADVDVDSSANTVWTEGNVTYVFVPTKNLPLLEPMRQAGFGWLADTLNEPLRALVEQGYNRNIPAAATPEPATQTLTSSNTESRQTQTSKTSSAIGQSEDPGTLTEISSAGEDYAAEPSTQRVTSKSDATQGDDETAGNKDVGRKVRSPAQNDASVGAADAADEKPKSTRVAANKLGSTNEPSTKQSPSGDTSAAAKSGGSGTDGNGGPNKSGGSGGTQE